MASLLAINYYLLCSIRYSAETSHVLLFVESVNGQFTRYKLRGLSKKFVEFVNKNKTTIPIAFKFVYYYDAFTMDIIAKF